MVQLRTHYALHNNVLVSLEGASRCQPCGKGCEAAALFTGATEVGNNVARQHDVSDIAVQGDP